MCDFLRSSNERERRGVDKSLLTSGHPPRCMPRGSTRASLAPRSATRVGLDVCAVLAVVAVDVNSPKACLSAGGEAAAAKPMNPQQGR